MATEKKVVYHKGPPKVTSQGRDHPPKNKHKRASWKKYRGQGRP